MVHKYNIRKVMIMLKGKGSRCSPASSDSHSVLGLLLCCSEVGDCTLVPLHFVDCLLLNHGECLRFWSH